MLMYFVHSALQLGDALSNLSDIFCLKIKSVLNQGLPLLRTLATLADLLCDFGEVVCEDLLDGVYEAVPLVIISIDASFILREHDQTVKLLQRGNFALHQIALNIELTHMLVFILHFLLHHLFIILSHHSDQEINEYHCNE